MAGRSKKIQTGIINIEVLNLNDINLAQYNPRTMTSGSFKKLKKNIERFGLVEPLVFNKRTSRLISGHQRIEILKKGGVEKASFSIVNLSPEDEKALNIALNNPDLQGEYDYPKLSIILKEIKFSLKDDYKDLGMLDLELSAPDLENIEIETVEEKQEKLLNKVEKRRQIDKKRLDEFIVDRDIKSGQLWKLEKHLVYIGDALDKKTREIFDTEGAIIITDPPYNLDYDYDSVNDNLSKEKYYNWLKKWNDLWDCKKKIITPGNDNLKFWLNNCKEKYNIGIWIKKNSRTRARLGIAKFQCWEPILFIGERFGNTRTHDIFEISRFQGGLPNIKWQHPCPKPVMLIEKFIQHYVPKIVIDTFLGSGTTIIAAERENKTCYGIEISAKYAAGAIHWWEKTTGKTATLEQKG